MKHCGFLKKALLSSCLPLPLFIGTFSACSSEQHEIKNHNIEIKNRDVATYENTFEIYGSTTQIYCETMEVKIEGLDSPLLALDSEIVSIQNDQFVLKFTVDGSVQENKSFNFDLNFTYSERDQTITQKLDNFNVYFFYEEEDTDRVSIATRYIEQVDKHEFDFQFYFSNKPTSNKISVSLVNEDTGLIYLMDDKFRVSYEEPYNIVVPVFLNLSTFETQTFNFSLILNFINSYGKEQEVKFINCVVSYVDGEGETVPEDWLNIVEVPSNNNGVDYILTGLSDAAHPIKFQSYSQLVIPDYVTSVSKNAFTNTSKINFKNINRLVIPNSVTKIEEGAFEGLTQLIEIDISSYTSFPSWLSYNSDPEHIIKIFGDLFWQSGYLWIGNDRIYDDKEKYLNDFKTIGVADKWAAFLNNDVIPFENYEMSEDKTTLIKIKDDAVENLENYKVVRLPPEIKSIQNDAFNELAKHPYINKQLNDQKETRRLIFNKNIVDLPNNCFKKSGIGGPIVFITPHLANIPESAFEECSHYEGFYEDEIVVETPSVIFASCYDLTSIGDYAFHLVPITILNSTDTFTIPDYVTSLSDFCFYGSKFKKIVFPNNDLYAVGNYAFADGYTWPQSPSIEEIDLKAYDEIVNPEEKVEDQTYIPDWFKADDHIFEGNVVDNGTIILSFNISSELFRREQEGELDRAEWEKSFKLRHGLKESWTISYVS
ncbi:MAG: leucine-rich repeat protein [Mycoplasmoidaceae bacterium]